jgi:hypothetical protein
LRINKKIELYSKLFGGHYINYLATKDLVERIQAEQVLTSDMRCEYRARYERHKELARYDEPHPSHKLIARFQHEVQAQIPAERLWWSE